MVCAHLVPKINWYLHQLPQRKVVVINVGCLLAIDLSGSCRLIVHETKRLWMCTECHLCNVPCYTCVNAHFGGCRVFGCVRKQGPSIHGSGADGIQCFSQTHPVPLMMLADHMPHFRTTPGSVIFRNGCLRPCCLSWPCLQINNLSNCSHMQN